VVLSDDFFDTRKVPDAAIKRLHFVLTIVGGTVVHNALTLTGSSPIVAVHTVRLKPDATDDHR